MGNSFEAVEYGEMRQSGLYQETLLFTEVGARSPAEHMHRLLGPGSC